MKKKKVVILGATGSVGTSALQVIRKHSKQLKLIGATASKNVKRLCEIAKEFKVRHLGIVDAEAYIQGLEEGILPEDLNGCVGGIALQHIATIEEADIVLVATTGGYSFNAILEAVKMGKTIAIANKETLIMLGSLLMPLAKKYGAPLIPVDSEHNAIFQCLEGRPISEVKKVILTASGGSLRDVPLNELEDVTLEEALAHPNWSMGPKVTIESATMANKGLELFEASWLFGLSPDKIDAVLHPQSVVHSMVEFIDGSILSQMSPPSMLFPIQHALLYPNRDEGVIPSVDFSQTQHLDFKPIDMERYPCFRLAKEVLKSHFSQQIVYIAANDAAVEGFMGRKFKFTRIAQIIETCLEKFTGEHKIENLDDIFDLYGEVQKTVEVMKS